MFDHKDAFLFKQFWSNRPTIVGLGYFIFWLYYYYIYQTLSLSYYYYNHTYHCHYYQDQKTTSPSSVLPAHSCGPPAVLVTPQFLSPIPGSLYPQCPHALNYSLTAVPQSIVGPHPNPNHSLCVSWLYGTAPLIPTNWYLGTKQSSILQTPYLLHQVLIENIFLPPGICDSSHYARYHIPPSHPGHSFKRYWPPSQLIG